MSHEQLKPCPFCGAEEAAVCKIENLTTGGFHHFDVVCERCGAETAADEDMGEAIAHWNRRPADE